MGSTKNNNQPNGRTSTRRETKSAVRASPTTNNDPSGEPVLGGKPKAQYALHQQPTPNTQYPSTINFDIVAFYIIGT
ncbi:MAG: hypothetical protein ACHBN1_05815 [Heteroscytonema crispum UTEX LB 1556]